tara:strand:+ start:2640 stop:3584 length:945 start_codon:yes stop_codon:yes gene_type:complete
MIIDTHAEFGIELVLTTPYAYYQHQQGKLEKIYVTKGMKPFYYFCNNVIEKYSTRTIDNKEAGLTTLPNDWLHHNAMSMFGKGHGEISQEEQSKANGVLDYSKWTPPPLKEKYKNNKFIFDKELVIIANSYNIEAGGPPTRYFNIECLYEMFIYLTEKGYKVIYHRPQNKSLPSQDQNELNSFNLGNIESEVEGIGLINDYQLTKYFDDVILFEDILNDNKDLKFNELQCMLYANCNKFISYVGGAGILCSYFGGTNIMWLSRGKESRKGYFEGDYYYKKLSNCNTIIVKDPSEKFPHQIENYREFLKTIKNIY